MAHLKQSPEKTGEAWHFDQLSDKQSYLPATERILKRCSNAWLADGEMRPGQLMFLLYESHSRAHQAEEGPVPSLANTHFYRGFKPHDKGIHQYNPSQQGSISSHKLGKTARVTVKEDLM